MAQVPVLETVPPPRVFLSYARADQTDDTFVEDLYRTLRRKRFGVWWDQTDMPSRGLTFLQEIRDAIDACDRVVLLIGPVAVRSDYVRQEWQYALVAGKIVNPVLIAGGLELLPPELRNLDCPVARRGDKRDLAMRHILRVLAQRPAKLGALSGPLPEAPGHFQPPVDQLSAVSDCALLDTRRPVVLKPAQRTTVIHGMPGAGKSVLAAAFGRSTEVRRAFAHGVIWIPAGSALKPDRVASVVCQAVGAVDTRKSASRDPTTRLREALKDKTCLIILDDVWSLDPVQPLVNALGTRSRLLITSRLAELQSSFGSLGLLVGELSEDAARRFLADWCDLPVEDLPAEAKEVARQCGFLPFALALCGAMVADGLKWNHLLANLKSANLGFLEKRLPNYPHPTILRAMSVSVSQLARERKTTAKRYLELAVFPPGGAIPLGAIETLWASTAGSDAAQTAKLLSVLQGKSLLRLTGDDRDRVVLHDLQWDYLSAAASNGRALHRRLIAAYDVRYPDGLATALEGDYILDQASWHLAEAEHYNRLYRLIDQEWFDRKCGRETLRRSFVTDVERVVSVSRRQCPEALHELARASLIRSNIGALAGSFPAEALYVLTRCGALGEATDALALVESPFRQCELFSEIATALKENGAAAQAKEFAMQALEVGKTVENFKLNALAWTARTLAELKDPSARQVFAQAKAESLAARPPAAVALAQTAAAAALLGHSADANELISRAASFMFVDGQSTSVVFNTWIRMGEVARIVQTVKKLKLSQPSTLEYVGIAALALARAGHIAEAASLWSRAVPALSRSRRPAPTWYSLIPARLGRRNEAVTWARRAVARLPKDERSSVHAELLARIAGEVAASGDPKHARPLAKRALSLTRSLRSSQTADTIGDSEQTRRIPELLAGVAGAFYECGDRALAVSVANEAMGKAMSFRWEGRTIGLAKAAIANALADLGRVSRAREIVEQIENDHARKKSFERLGRIYALHERFRQCLEAMGHIEDWARPTALANAIKGVPQQKLARAASKLLPAMPDGYARVELLCWLAWQLPDRYLAQAGTSLADSGDATAEAALYLGRALSRQHKDDEVRSLLDQVWRNLPKPDRPERMEAGGCVAELLTLTGERSRWRALMKDLDATDNEYSACALSRAALAFVEAGWTGEAERVARRALARARRIGEGRPHGTGDAFTRLARVMAALHLSDETRTCATNALQALAGQSGSSSAFAVPNVVRQSVGNFLGNFMSPKAALTVIVDAARKKPPSVGYVSADTALGLYESVVARRRFDDARRLAPAIIDALSERSSWLTVRMAALHETHQDRHHAQQLLADALEDASRGGPGQALDVIEQGAPIMAHMAGGRTLEDVYRSLIDVQGWRTIGSPAEEGQPTLVQRWR